MALPKRENLAGISEATRKKYLQGLQVQVLQLREAMERSDFGAVAEICHRLSGSAALFGLPDLGHAARSTEEAARKGQVEQVVEGFQIIEVVATRNWPA